MPLAPTIHLNGTSRDDLLSGYLNVLTSLRVAQHHLQAAGPNARDYYVQAQGAFAIAQDEHRARLRKLEEITAEIQAIAEAVSDQGGR